MDPVTLSSCVKDEGLYLLTGENWQDTLLGEKSKLEKSMSNMILSVVKQRKYRCIFIVACTCMKKICRATHKIKNDHC